MGHRGGGWGITGQQHPLEVLECSGSHHVSISMLDRCCPVVLQDVTTGGNPVEGAGISVLFLTAALESTMLSK